MSNLFASLIRYNMTELVQLFLSKNIALVRVGSGTPEAAVTAPIGSLYVNTAGGASTTLYVKTSGAGNTGWTAK